MKKQIVIGLLALASCSTISIPLQAHAENSGGISNAINAIKTRANEIKSNNAEMKSNRKGFEEKFENVTKYIKQDLTKEERVKAKAIIESKIKSMAELNKYLKTSINSGNTISTGSIETKVTSVYTAFKTEITPYIDSTKLEAFNTRISEKIKLIATNRNLKAANTAIKNQISTKKEEVKTVKKTEKELKVIANETKALKELVKKIEEVLKKTTTQSVKDALSIAKTALQTQIAATGSGTVTK